ncbi:FG-GAP and VCBS repeat-containing protein [Streptomyces sp. NPDC000594]|uniref:FG-GAP and VCBS repeat-containing protein n=1 Tax=Streptomyces sp. NPDC000594 TaxID=3154261 RepID=UPI00331F67EE
MSMRTSLTTGAATVLALALAGGLTGASAGDDATATAPANGNAPAVAADDFDGDGHRDHATALDGRVTVVHGTARGTDGRRKSFTQDSPGIPGTVTATDEFFGADLAAADFDQDGYADLAVGDFYEKVGRERPGMVMIVWGSAAGLGSRATVLPNRTTQGGFGFSLATGDFDADGRPDLAATGSAELLVHHGGFRPGGTGGPIKSIPIAGHPTLDHNGTVVAGRIDGDRADDLYLLGSGFDRDRGELAAAWFIRGGTTLRPGRTVVFNSQESYGRADAVVADFDRNGHGDLAIGDFMHRDGRGAVAVLPGTANGPGAPYRITQDTTGVATRSNPNEGFGVAVSAGDTNRDGYPDLAVGAPWEKVSGATIAGGTHILRGGGKGLTGAGSRWFTRATASVPGAPAKNESMGAYVRLRDFDHDGDADLLMSGHLKKNLLLQGGAHGIGAAGAREVPLHAGHSE